MPRAVYSVSESDVGKLVRIKDLRGGRCQRWGRAKLIEVHADTVTVLPLGRHGRYETVPRKYCKLWLAKQT